MIVLIVWSVVSIYSIFYDYYWECRDQKSILVMVVILASTAITAQVICGISLCNNHELFQSEQKCILLFMRLFGHSWTTVAIPRHQFSFGVTFIHDEKWLH